MSCGCSLVYCCISQPTTLPVCLDCIALENKFQSLHPVQPTALASPFSSTVIATCAHANCQVPVVRPVSGSRTCSGSLSLQR